MQDDWKISKKLTLNLGMRYEVGLPYYDTQNRYANFVLGGASQGLVLASNSGGYSAKAMTNVDTNGWEPRIGLAYQLDSKTVIRTGYGIYRTYFEQTGDTEFLCNNPPFAFQVALAASKTAPAVDLQAGPPAGSVSLAKATGLISLLTHSIQNVLMLSSGTSTSSGSWRRTGCSNSATRVRKGCI